MTAPRQKQNTTQKTLAEKRVVYEAPDCNRNKKKTSSIRTALPCRCGRAGVVFPCVATLPDYAYLLPRHVFSVVFTLLTLYGSGKEEGGRKREVKQRRDEGRLCIRIHCVCSTCSLSLLALVLVLTL